MLLVNFMFEDELIGFGIWKFHMVNSYEKDVRSYMNIWLFMIVLPS